MFLRIKVVGSFKEFQGLALQICKQRKHFTIMVRLRSGKEYNIDSSSKKRDKYPRQTLHDIVNEIDDLFKTLEEPKYKKLSESQEIKDMKQRLSSVRDFMLEFPYTGFVKARVVYDLIKIKKMIIESQESEEKTKKQNNGFDDELCIDQCRPLF